MTEKSADPLDQAGKLLLDVLHVTVGFGVLAFQKVQVARRELEAEMERRFPKTSS
jgi:hypothetical protein